MAGSRKFRPLPDAEIFCDLLKYQNIERDLDMSCSRSDGKGRNTLVSRRELLIQLSTYWTFASMAGRASASQQAEHVAYWLHRTEELTAMMRGEVITIQDWRTGLDQLNRRIDLDTLLNDMDYKSLVAATQFADLGVSTAKIDFGDYDIRTLSFYPKLFAVGKGRAIIPHGHSNMVSAHLVTSGRFHLRQYDKVDLDVDSMLVRPSFEGEVSPGDLSSIGENEDNVHWFVALEPSYTLDVIVTGVDGNKTPVYDIHNLDMDNAKTEGDLLRVPASRGSGRLAEIWLIISAMTSVSSGAVQDAWLRQFCVSFQTFRLGRAKAKTGRKADNKDFVGEQIARAESNPSASRPLAAHREPLLDRAMPLTLCTWNINSVRLRAHHVVRFLKEQDVDVMCLQEIKCANGEFPAKVFTEAGYAHHHVRGQKGLHGVATISRLPLETLDELDHCQEGHARVAVSRVQGIELHNYYIPAGGDDPDPEANPKFAHKLEFVRRFTAWSGANKARLAKEPAIFVGDFNIAPRENDVWSHKQLLDVVSHTPIEVDGLNGALEAGGYTDVARALIPEPERIYTWWSYRARDWRKSNRGRRLDHIWTSQALKSAVESSSREAFCVHDDARDWEKPSDHAPVVWRMP